VDLFASARRMPLDGEKKYFKVIEGNLHVFNRESERKAENVYILSHWNISKEEDQSSIRPGNSVTKDAKCEETQNERSVSKNLYIKLENSDQLGCDFRMEDSNATIDLFKAIQEIQQVC